MQCRFVNYITALCWLFYNGHEALTVIVSNVYSFYVSFVGLVLGLGLGTAGLDYKTTVLCRNKGHNICATLSTTHCGHC